MSGYRDEGRSFRYTDRKAYEEYVRAVSLLGSSSDDLFGPVRVVRGDVVLWPKKLSVYDGLFGSVPLYSVSWSSGGFPGSPLRPAYLRLSSRIVTSLYLSLSRWKDAERVFPLRSNWIDDALARDGRRWITRQMRGYRGLRGDKKGYLLPEPVPMSQVVFEEYGVDPLRSVPELVYDRDGIDRILNNGWYPLHIFKGIASFGGMESLRRGVRVLVVDEDFVPRTPLSAAPFDRLLFDAFRRMLAFVDRVWEDPSVLDSFSVDSRPFVVYRRADMMRDGVEVPVVLPDFGVPWGLLLYYLQWYTVSYYNPGLYDLKSQSRALSGDVESVLGTYTVFPAVSPFKPLASYIGFMALSSAERTAKFFDDYAKNANLEYGSLGVLSVWRYMQPVFTERKAGSDVFVLARDVNTHVWASAFARNWVFGFGYLEERNGSYRFYVGDPLMEFSPSAVLGVKYFDMGRFMWFNYRSLPFFEFMRKFVFLIFEMWRRVGKGIFGAMYFGDGVVHVSRIFSPNSVPFRDIDRFVSEYSSPDQFRKLPFHIVFNIAMSIFPSIMYADSLPFRMYHYLAQQYHWHQMHHRPYVRVVLEDEGSVSLDGSNSTPLYQVTGWFLKPTYVAVSRAYIGRRWQNFSGEPFALGEDSSYSPWQSWYAPGVVLFRFPFYDPLVFEFLVSYLQNMTLYPQWEVFDATGGERFMAFFDETTSRFVPYSRQFLYYRGRSGLSPLSVVLRGHVGPLLVWVARVFSGVADRPALAKSIVRQLYLSFGSRGPDVLRLLCGYLRGRAKKQYVRYVSELFPQLAGSMLKVCGEGGSEGEPLSLKVGDSL